MKITNGFCIHLGSENIKEINENFNILYKNNELNFENYNNEMELHDDLKSYIMANYLQYFISKYLISFEISLHVNGEYEVNGEWYLFIKTFSSFPNIDELSYIENILVHEYIHVEKLFKFLQSLCNIRYTIQYGIILTRYN